MEWKCVQPKDPVWQDIAKKIDEKEWGAAHYLAANMRKKALLIGKVSLLYSIKRS